MDKNSEGAISPEERTELETLVKEAEMLAANARRLAQFSEKAAGTGPVTVWSIFDSFVVEIAVSRWRGMRDPGDRSKA